MFDKKLIKLIGKNYKYIIYSVIMMIINLLCNILITFSICWIIDNAIKLFEFEKYLIPSGLIIGGIIFKYICVRSLTLIKNKLGDAVKGNLRNDMFVKITKLGTKNDNPILGKASLTQLSVEGIEQLDLYYSVYLPQLFYSLIAPLILFTIVVFFSWEVALVLLVCVPLIPVSIMLISRYAKRVFAKYWSKYIRMGEGFLDNIRGLKELKILYADSIQQKKMDQQSEEFRVITMKVLIMQLASVTIMDLVAYGGAAAAIILTLFNLINNSLSIPVSLFLMLIAIEFFIPLRTLGSGFHLAMNGITAGKKIIEIMEYEAPKWGNSKFDNSSLYIHNLNHSYNTNNNVLKDINLKFNKNAINAIVGESGSGKTTLINLLAGFLKVQDGKICYGKNEINKIQRKEFYNNVALISYDSYIFNMSIYENFKLINRNVNEQEIWKYLKKVNLHHFVKNVGGLNYNVSEDANNLSGGQKQRLALAINLAAKKSVYIFDEATSNIDLQSENIIMQNIAKLKKYATVIIVSHRLANIENADYIYYLEKGKILSSGSHQNLLSSCEQYTKLYDEQNKLEKLINLNVKELFNE